MFFFFIEVCADYEKEKCRLERAYADAVRLVQLSITRLENAIRSHDVDPSVENSDKMHELARELNLRKEILRKAKENLDKHLKKKNQDTKDNPQINSISNNIKKLTASIHNIENKLRKKENARDQIPNRAMGENWKNKKLLKLNGIIADLKNKLVLKNNARNAALELLKKALENVPLSDSTDCVA